MCAEVTGSEISKDLYLQNEKLVKYSWPNSQMPECTCSISQNAPFQTEMFCWNGAFWNMEQVHSGICEIGLIK